MNRVLRTFVGSVLVLLLGATNGWAQATAQINGAVRDADGGSLPGATVVAIQTETGLRRETVTDDTGAYALPNLPLGPYRLEVSLPGFRTYAQTGVVLQVNSNPVIPVTLQLGGLEETIQVEASAPLVETRNPAVGSIIDNEQVEALPLEGRNPVSLIVLAGGAADTGPPTSRSMSNSRGIAISGGQPFAVSYLLDGAMHNNVLDGLNLPLPFPDALQEFSVETSSQNAANGRQGSGTVSAVTKSGTNTLHGDLFEFARHHRFNATSPFASRDASGERRTDGLVRNQFGGTLGGPLVQNRLFFFGAYQGTRGTQTPADIITFIPTAAMLAGDFSQLASAACNARGAVALRAPFVDNRVNPALLSPAAVNIARRLPTTTDPCGRITYSRQLKPTEGQTIARADFQLTTNHSLFGRYMLTTNVWDPAFANNPDNILVAGTTGGGGRDNSSQSLVVGDTMVLSSTMVNSIRFTANRTEIQRTHADMFGPEDVGVDIYSHVPNYMIVSITGAFGVNFGTETASWYRPNTYGISDDLTLLRGSHQWAFGGSIGLSDWKTNSNVRSPGAFSFNGGVTGLPLADFMTGRVFEFRQSTPFTLDITQKYFGFYAQDTWRASPKMTVNYGVRWEPWFPQEHRQSQIYNFDQTLFRSGQRSQVFPQAPPGFTYPGDQGFPTKAGMERVWANVQPRVGLSWDPRGDGRTSVRAGYGMNSNFIAGEFFFDAAQAPPFGLEQRLTGVQFDNPWASAGRPNPYPVTGTGGTQFPPYALLIQAPKNLETTRVHNWNVALQHQVGETMAVSATYLGNRLNNVWGDVTGNAGTLPATNATGPCTLRNPSAPGGMQTYPNCSTAPLDVRREITQADPSVGQFIGYLDWVTDQGWQRYHGMMLQFQRRSTRGVAVTGNYTWSTCRGLVNQGGAPLNVGTGYTQPVSLINPPANASDLFALDEGRCANSPTHIFNFTASAETPQFGNRVARMLGSGWRLSGIFRGSSGNFLTVSTGLLHFTGVAATTARVNATGADPYGDRSVSNWFNPAGFSQPAAGTFGNSQRNAYEGPGRRVIDLSLVRSFRFGTHRFDARVEAFNALNWFQWGDPITNFSDANFGRILTLAGDPRVMQFALKYSF